MSTFASTSPFISSAFTPAAAKSSDDDVEYAIVRHTDVSVEGAEVERTDREVVEVQVRWGRTVIGMHHVRPGASLAIGECDGGAITLPKERLGVDRWTLLSNGSIAIPPGSKAIVERDGVRGLVDLDGQELKLVRGMRVRITMGEGSDVITIAVAQLAAGSVPKRHGKKLGVLAALLGVSLLGHLGAVTALSLAPGDSLDADDSPVDRATAAYLTSLSRNQMDRDRAEEDSTSAAASEASGGKTGAAHKGPSGMMGRLDSSKTNGAYAIAGPPETKEQHLAKTRALIASGEYGAIGALSTVFGASGPIDIGSSWNSESGTRPVSFEGNLFGSHEGDAFGSGGLGLLGPAGGGGGFSDGLGLGRVGDFGYNDGKGGYEYGTCTGPRCGSAMKRDPKPAPKIIERGGEDVTGGLPKEIVQRIVRANFPRLRVCYEAGLRRDPSLRGTVTTRFIIDTTGAVESSSLAGTTMSDPSVAKCVAGVFGTMSFPEPTNGKALVLYPISFDND